MSQLFYIHPDNPQLRLIKKAAEYVKKSGSIIVYPTDSAYAIGCCIGDKTALDRIRAIRELEKDHNFTLMCRDLSELSSYAKVDNQVYRLLRAHTPGSYTFILKATKEVPKRLQHPKRKSIGIRVPDNAIVLGILEQLEEPLMSVTLRMPDQDTPLIEPEAIKEILGNRVDLIIDGGYCGLEMTSVIDLTEDVPRVIRKGKGDVAAFE